MLFEYLHLMHIQPACWNECAVEATGCCCDNASQLRLPPSGLELVTVLLYL